MYEVVNLIYLHNIVLKYDFHFNRMSNYIIHSFLVVMELFAWLYLHHECVAILEKYMFRTDTTVGTYNYIQHPS